MIFPINSSSLPLPRYLLGRRTRYITDIICLSRWTLFIYMYTRMCMLRKFKNFTINSVTGGGRIGDLLLCACWNFPRVSWLSTNNIISSYVISHLILKHFIWWSNLKSRTYTASFISYASNKIWPTCIR